MSWLEAGGFSVQEPIQKDGLADYEVRYFHTRPLTVTGHFAWQRHMTLCLLAHSFLALCRHEQRKKIPLPLFVCLSLAECQTLFNLFGSPQITGTLDKLTPITRVRQVTYRA
jgi:hypothetical protein